MKKTILLLSLFASCAMGDDLTLEDAIYTGTDYSTITLEESLTQLTAVAVLDVDKLKSVMLSGVTAKKYTLINFDGDNDIGVQTNYTSSSGMISSSGLWGCWSGNSSAYKFGMGTGFESESFWTGAASAAVTLTYSYDTGTTALFTLLDSAGEVLQSIGGTWATSLKGQGLTFSAVTFNSDIVESTYIFDSVVTADNATTLSLAAAKEALIPEPSTATLSLLALAGLAVRRRRR